ncbi:hypothetical protein DPMN_101895 [Dreissena polymorpha]|uniref:Uncharacterized protein n=1 Tax=Dreissena polymorpha TaxID=45954 RepID=A0A9D4LK43_DREPO|nr:hypothetical protein DPMN_101895 [Dreissena polymorpha]
MASPSETYLNYLAKAIFPVEFTRHEIYCVPSHLIYEAHRTITDHGRRRRKSYKGKGSVQWMDCIVTDAKPFLYYLRFLASCQTNGKLRAALNMLQYFISGNNGDSEGHRETALNMLGHIYELAESKSRAWGIYKWSVGYTHNNHAAYWHLFRLFGQYVYNEADSQSVNNLCTIRPIESSHCHYFAKYNSGMNKCTMC